MVLFIAVFIANLMIVSKLLCFISISCLKCDTNENNNFDPEYTSLQIDVWV